MKQCSKCKIKKPLSEFYKNKSRSDGYNLWCKLCLKPLIKNHKQSDEYRRKQKVYSKKPEIRQRLNEGRRRRHSEYPEKYRQESRRYYAELMEKSPEKRKARDAINHAIRYRGFPKAKSQQCKYCSKQAQEYHHPSYLEENWLKVEPVCKKCHAKIGELENA